MHRYEDFCDLSISSGGWNGGRIRGSIHAPSILTGPLTHEEQCQSSRAQTTPSPYGKRGVGQGHPMFGECG
ncbi:hypothetical protein I3843_03G204500 [Carya illinoinensis]|uniref:Uncharacterized protein n=1 Tax=Carya illinoinensis TaxID=32201 RepID=A0A922FNS8_CARIL|nr:hypothetical protein I3842_03G206900 [Carya illinoinensis]KAG7988786.1 hypothetical protein I3843_03G204500 [Carya illinoinensis]